MDEYVRSLSLNNSSKIDDVLYPCYKIMRYLKTSSKIQMSYNEVETHLKAAFFIEECFSLFEDSLLKELVAKFPIYESFFDKCMTICKEEGYITYACANILKSKNGVQHFSVLENILTHLEGPDRVKEIIRKLETPLRVEDVSLLHDDLIYVIQRMFQLPNVQMNSALTRLMDNFSFENICQILLEPEASPYFDKCTILHQKICDKLAKGDISNNFINSMHYTVARSDKGLHLYWKCLRDCIFANSLSKFFVHHLCGESMVDSDIKDDENYDVCGNIYFLVNAAMVLGSPCRSTFSNMFHDLNVSQLKLEKIYKSNFSYLT